MTEAEWLTCDKVVVPVMNWLRRQGDGRQFYLAGCAALRHVFHALPDDRFQDLVTLVERYADGLALANDVRRRRRGLEAVVVRNMEALQLQGRTLAQASKEVAAYAATIHLARPDAGWEAGYSAMVEAARVGKRADQWLWQCAMLRDIFGNPFRTAPALDPAWLHWNDGTAVAIAQAIYEERRFEDLAILADALEEAGCTSGDILEHCRGPGPHVRGC